MSMFMASMRRAYLAGELHGDGMTSAWLRSMVEDHLHPLQTAAPPTDGPKGQDGMEGGGS